MATISELRAKYDEAVSNGDIAAANSFATQAKAMLEQEGRAPVEAPQATAPTASQQLMSSIPETMMSMDPYTMGLNVPNQQMPISGVARYAPPIVAGLATGGFGLAPAAIVAGTTLASETIADFLEKGDFKDFNVSGPLSAAATALSPITRFSKPIASISPSVASFLTSAATSAVAGEVGRAIRTGEAFPESEGRLDSVLRFTTPFLSGFAGGMGSKLSAGTAAAAEASARRGGAGLFNADGTFANAILSDANPAFQGIEGRNLKNFNSRAIERLLRMDENMPNVVNSLVQESPENTPIARELMKHMNLGELKTQSDAAEKAAKAAADAAETARKTYAADAKELMASAEVALRDSMRKKAAFDMGLKKVLGGKIPTIYQTNPVTVSEEVKRIATDAKKAVKLSTDALYDASGIRIDDAVVSIDDVLESASKQVNNGGLLSGQGAQKKFVDAVTAYFGDKQTLSREAWLEFKDSYATRLRNGSSIPKDVNKADALANSQYKILVDASQAFIDRTYGPDILKQWNAANSAFASSKMLGKTNAVELISEGKFSDFFKLIRDGGKDSPVWKELNQYVDFLSNVTDRAIRTGSVDPADLAVAQNFKEHVYAGMLLGMVDESLVDGARKGARTGVDAIDPVKFVQNVTELETRGGFPIKDVFGADTNDFKRLARFIDKKFEGRMTQQELVEWLDMLPKHGATASTDRLVYRKAVRDALLETDIAKKFDKLKQAERESGSLVKNAEARLNEFKLAESDPLTRFFADTNFKIDPTDYANNANLANRIVSEVDPSVVKDFVRNSKVSGKENLVDELGKSASANLVRRFLPASTPEGKALKLRDITDLFYGDNEKLIRQRENLINLIGKDRFNLLDEKIVKPISEIISKRQSLQRMSGDATAFNDLRAIGSIYGGATGAVTSAMIQAQAARSILRAADQRMYNVMANIYLNPKNSKALESVGYDLARFAQLSPIYAAEVSINMGKDNQANSNQPTR